MDPIVLKYIQLAIAQVTGIGILIVGLTMLFRGLAGKSTLLIEGATLKAKLTNASPGILVSIIGLVLVITSLNWKVEQTETGSIVQDVSRLDEWKLIAESLNGTEKYIDVRNRFLNKAGSRTREEYKTMPAARSLADLSKELYGNSAYWRILAAINIDRGSQVRQFLL